MAVITCIVPAASIFVTVVVVFINNVSAILIGDTIVELDKQ
jgi:hypothetical protein